MRNYVMIPSLLIRCCSYSNQSGSRKFASSLNYKAFVPYLHPSFREASTKAAFCNKVDEPLKIEDYKEEKLNKGEIRIKVHYCALNPRDLLLIKGAIPAKTPFVPGYEVSGEVIEIAKGDGKESTKDDDDDDSIVVGDKVVALSKSWLGGLRSHCVAPIQDVWKFKAIESEKAAGLIINYGHALLSLFRRAKIKKDKVLVITADTGGRGLAALDIAANVYKAKVVGVCDSSEMADFMRERGAWSAIKMDAKSLKAAVRDIVGDKGVDIVYETVGGNFLAGAMQCVKHEGLVILADIPGPEDVIKPAEWFNMPHTFNMTALSLHHYRDRDYPVYRQAVSDVIELCEQNLISPDVPHIFELKDVNEAVKMLKEHKVLGKILVKLGG
ncbi:quinone oxidoreductase-like protein 2 [Macrosteles quadrilineatus]|uniref:quinone oxidoreductase-like protein 2 n=1 Tax=Macrosteles quadrilineatus TaxID=74068 RepID=UPI0023E318B5|nr:quinone oxidoreductase-like protein 2 [Macrosteles quadrilineatus]